MSSVLKKCQQFNLTEVIGCVSSSSWDSGQCLKKYKAASDLLEIPVKMLSQYLILQIFILLCHV